MNKPVSTLASAILILLSTLSSFGQVEATAIKWYSFEEAIKLQKERILPILDFLGNDFYQEMKWQEYLNKNKISL